MKPLAAVRQSLAPAEPWHTPVYLAQVFTFRIAASLAGDFRNVTEWGEHRKPPFCLRLRPAYRTAAVRAFRNTVARAARQARIRYTWEVTAWDKDRLKITRMGGPCETRGQATAEAMEAHKHLVSIHGDINTLPPVIGHT